MVIIYNEWK